MTSLYQSFFERERVLALLSILLVLLIPLLYIASLIDDRTVNGVSVWVKPMKFNLSIAFYLGTLGWFSGWIDRSLQHGTAYAVYRGVTIVTATLLLLWLYSAAALGEPAHFNKSHPVLSPLYGIMGLVSVVFTSATLWMALMISRNRQSPLTDYFKYSIVWSLIVTFVFTVTLGAELASKDSHWVGGTPSDTGGLWLFGWSRDGGDLRVAHFFSVHAMHFIPLLALAGVPTRFKQQPQIAAMLLAAVYTTLILFVYLQAKQGLAFI